MENADTDAEAVDRSSRVDYVQAHHTTVMRAQKGIPHRTLHNYETITITTKLNSHDSCVLCKTIQDCPEFFVWNLLLAAALRVHSTLMLAPYVAALSAASVNPPRPLFMYSL